jgi:hypothetical protein
MKKLFIPLILSAAFSAQVQASDLKTYEVTITNATSHQVITPPLVVTHNRHFSLFHVTGTASDGLATLAESGNPVPLSDEVSNAPGVRDVVAGAGPIVYGTSASVTITARKHDRLSLAAMLATTNDGFAGLTSVALPKRSATYYAQAYDAGSETNNELCSHIPGPPCAPGSGNASDDGEGFITIHGGIHGVGDLAAASLDWRGPVAIVTIKRLH